MMRDSDQTVSLQSVLGECVNSSLKLETMYDFPLSPAPDLTSIGLVSIHYQQTVVEYLLLLNALCMDKPL